MYLGSDISFLSCTRGWGNCTVDGDYNHGPGQIEINGHIFEKGYVSHAPGKATFPLYGLHICQTSICSSTLTHFDVLIGFGDHIGVDKLEDNQLST